MVDKVSKNGGVSRRRFFAILEKLQGVFKNPPPPSRARVIPMKRDQKSQIKKRFRSRKLRQSRLETWTRQVVAQELSSRDLVAKELARFFVVVVRSSGMENFDKNYIRRSHDRPIK